MNEQAPSTSEASLTPAVVEPTAAPERFARLQGLKDKVKDFMGGLPEMSKASDFVEKGRDRVKDALGHANKTLSEVAEEAPELPGTPTTEALAETGFTAVKTVRERATEAVKSGTAVAKEKIGQVKESSSVAVAKEKLGKAKETATGATKKGVNVTREYFTNEKNGKKHVAVTAGAIGVLGVAGAIGVYQVRKNRQATPNIAPPAPTPELTAGEVLDKVRDFNQLLENDKTYVPTVNELDEMRKYAGRFSASLPGEEGPFGYKLDGASLRGQESRAARRFLDNVNSNKWLLDDVDRDLADHIDTWDEGLVLTNKIEQPLANDLMTLEGFKAQLGHQRSIANQLPLADNLAYQQYQRYVRLRGELDEHVESTNPPGFVSHEDVVKGALADFMQHTKDSRKLKTKQLGPVPGT